MGIPHARDMGLVIEESLMPRPKPPEPFHRFPLRLPQSLWQKLADRSSQERSSINHQIRTFIEAEMLDSLIINGHHPAPADELPWLEREDL